MLDLKMDLHPCLALYQVIDSWYKSNDEESFAMSRMLINEEGLL